MNLLNIFTKATARAGVRMGQNMQVLNSREMLLWTTGRERNTVLRNVFIRKPVSLHVSCDVLLAAALNFDIFLSSSASDNTSESPSSFLGEIFFGVNMLIGRFPMKSQTLLATSSFSNFWLWILSFKRNSFSFDSIFDFTTDNREWLPLPLIRLLLGGSSGSSSAKTSLTTTIDSLWRENWTDFLRPFFFVPQARIAPFLALSIQVDVCFQWYYAIYSNAIANLYRIDNQTPYCYQICYCRRHQREWTAWK